MKRPTTGQYDGFEGGNRPGFGIRVGKRTKTFFVSVRINGKPERVTIGQYETRGVPALRSSWHVIVLMRSSAMPRRASAPDEKKRDEKGTFGAVTEAFMQDYAEQPRTRVQMQRQINVDLAEWHDRQIADITRADTKELLREKARTAPISANRFQALISKIFNWAVKEELIAASPAMQLDRPGGERRTRERSLLGADEIRTAWVRVRQSWLSLSVRCSSFCS